MKLELALKDPFLKDRPNKLQQCLLTLDLSGKGIQFRHIVAGRGASKSTGLILFLIQRALKDKLIILYLSPTYRMINDNFLPLWKDIVPTELYKYNGSEKKINLINGSQIWLRSRSVDSPAKGADSLRGINAHIILDDEAALGYDKKFFTTSLACLRKPGKYHAYITATTPKISEYSHMVRSPGHKLYTFKTVDNPYLPDGFVETARQEMSEQEFKREFEAEFTELGGKIWSTFKDKDFYMGGNRLNYVYDHTRPYILSLDIGSASASLLAIQQTSIDNSNKHVIFAEFHGSAKEDNSVKRLLEMANKKYGFPQRVVAGNDINTRSSTDNSTPLYFVRQQFGGIPVTAPSGDQRNKYIQYDVSSALICNGANDRRLLVAQNLDSYDPDSRGIIKMFELDAFPEKLSNDFLPKDHRFEHVRDAMMYYIASYANTPKFNDMKTNYING